MTNTVKQVLPPKPFKWQKRTFIKLIQKARKTEFGQAYGFDEILNAAVFDDERAFYEEFKRRVPIFDYTKLYNEWWHKVRAGKPDVTWPGKVTHFALSSGTSEAASKAIPVTKCMIKAIQRTSINQIISLGNYKELPADLYEKGYLMLGGSTLLNEIEERFEGDLSGITQKTLPFWFDRFYKPGKKIAQERNWANKLEEICENAPDWDIGFLAGVPAWMQLLLEKIIERHQVNNIHDIWPNLAAFAWGGVAFEPYRKGFEKLLGKPILYLETYLASEGFLAYQARPDADIQLVLKHGIFFEFIPFNEQNFDADGNLLPNVQTLMVDEVEEQTEYAILISTCAGAWRYLIGDTVKFTNKKLAEIKITGRTKHFLSLCGEHLSVDNMNRAIDMANEYFGIHITEFTVIGVKHPPLFGHQWYVGCNDIIDVDILCHYIDSCLRQLNDDYGVERDHALKHVSCKVLPLNTFYNWMKANGKEGGQHKFPRVLKGNQAENWQQFIEQQAIDN